MSTANFVDALMATFLVLVVFGVVAGALEPLFKYFKKHNLKKMYLCFLTVLIVIIFILDILFLKLQYPEMALSLILIQTIIIPIIAWNRPEEDFTTIQMKREAAEDWGEWFDNYRHTYTKKDSKQKWM